jgi:peptidylprolyl isomerase
MRLLSIAAGLAGLFLATSLPAQEEPASAPPPAAEQPAPEPPAASQPETPALAAPASAPVTPPPPPPPPALTADNTWNLDLSNGGRVTIQLRSDVAPNHAERIKSLTRQGFYNGLIFHRVIQGFMAQGGDPTGTGTGGSELPDLAAEVNGLPHVRGALGMARAQDLNSANSQFYIMFGPRLNMDRNYTVVGRVVGGMNFVDAIERGEPPLNPTRIIRASLGTDNVPPMSAEQLQVEGARMAAAQRAATAPTAAPGQPVVLVPQPGVPSSLDAPPPGTPQPAPTTPQ